MNMKKIIISLSWLLAVTHNVLSQVSPVVVRNHPDNTMDQTTVEIKWVTRSIVLPEGANLYRRQAGTQEWQQLNSLPLTQADALAPSLAEKLPQAQDFFEIAGQIKDEDLNEVGFILINMYNLIFQYNEFAEALGIYYKDATAVPGVTYEYRAARIRNGKEEDIGVSLPIRAGVYQKAPPVENFNVKQVKKVVELAWNVDDSRFISYNIYYNIKDSLQNVKLNKQPIFPTMVTDSTGADVYPSPHFRFSKMAENKIYSFWIEGMDLFGASSEASPPLTFLFNDITPPEPPTDLSGRVDSMKVFLNWTPSISPDVKEHVLYRSNQSDTLFEAIKTFTIDTSYIDTVAVPGPYFYYLRALDQAGNRRTSKIVYVNVGDVDPPAQPKGLVIASDTGKLELSWRANTEPDLLGYQIFRTVNNDQRSHYILVNSEPYDSTVFVEELPKVVKNKFFYYIVAVDTAFNRSEPSDFAIGQMPDILPPEQPFIKKITYEDEQMIITWIPNVDNDLMGYDLYRSDSAEVLDYQKVNPQLIARDAFRFIDRQAAPNKGYLYHLKALDSAGNASFPSLPAYGYLRVVEKTDYSKLKASVKYNKQRKLNVIRWLPLEEGGITGYVVFKAEEGEKLKPLTGLLQTATARDKITPGKRTTYQVKAYTATGEMITSEKLTIENKAKKDD